MQDCLVSTKQRKDSYCLTEETDGKSSLLYKQWFRHKKCLVYASVHLAEH